METRFQTSFIPKAPISSSGEHQAKSTIGLFSFLATLIFIISLALAGGAFGYRAYLQNDQDQKKSDLEKNVNAFELPTIQEYVRLDARMSTARALLNKHISASNILNYLSTVTLKTIRFNDYKYDLNSDGTIKISMTGQAKSYNSVAYQSQVFGETKALKGPIFSNLDLDNKGNVVFNFTTGIDPSFISYTNTLDQRINNASPADNSSASSSISTSGASVQNTGVGTANSSGSNLIPLSK